VGILDGIFIILFLGKRLISTGLKVALPSGHYGRLASRSGLALNHFIAVGAGVIDADYRGEIKVLLFNFGAEDFQV
jgi:dUTP pyrophosphatase